MTDEVSSSGFFVVGGTLGLDASSCNIQCVADEELLRLAMAGEYCNVLLLLVASIRAGVMLRRVVQIAGERLRQQSACECGAERTR
jgi:hypothetical protein